MSTGNLSCVKHKNYRSMLKVSLTEQYRFASTRGKILLKYLMSVSSVGRTFVLWYSLQILDGMEDRHWKESDIDPYFVFQQKNNKRIVTTTI